MWGKKLERISRPFTRVSISAAEDLTVLKRNPHYSPEALSLSINVRITPVWHDIRKSQNDLLDVEITQPNVVEEEHVYTHDHWWWWPPTRCA